MSVRKLTYGGLLVALAIILPSMFHMVGLGSVFLPMHIPVLFSGFVCGPVIGMLVGMMSPILSSVITGMPPLVPPIAQGMVVELALYGLLTGVLYERLRLGAYISLAGAMISGRIAYGVMGYLVLPMFGFAKTPIWAPLLGVRNFIARGSDSTCLHSAGTVADEARYQGAASGKARSAVII